MASRPPCSAGVVVLLAFCLHNAWNCWTFLNASCDIDASRQLFQVSEEKLGLLNTVALLGILCSLPLSIFCKWRRRLLLIGLILNAGAPLMRYVGAEAKSYNLLVASFGASGAAFGVLGVWPPILASTFFSEKHWASVTAFATLSNSAGGAFAAILMPVLTGGSADGLLWVFWMQVYISIVLFLLIPGFLWLPDAHLPSMLSNDCHAYLRPQVVSQSLIFGVMVGVAIGLQNINSPMLEGVGFTGVTAGIANCAFQLASVVVGIGVGTLVKKRQQLKHAIRWLHYVALASSGGVLVVCWCVSFLGGGVSAQVCLFALEIIQGASVMGSMPLLFQEAVYTSSPASENFVTGVINFVGIGFSAALNQIACTVTGLQAAAVVLGIVMLQTLGFVAHERRWKPSDAYANFSGPA